MVLEIISITFASEFNFLVHGNEGRNYSANPIYLKLYQLNSYED